MFTSKDSQLKLHRLFAWLPLLLVFSLLFSIGAVPSSPTGAKPPTATPGTAPTATPSGGGGVIWQIGTLDDSNAEFTGTVGTFTVGTSPTSAFPARLSGGNTTQTIVFNLASVPPGDYYLKFVAKDTAQNSTSGLQATLNGHKWTPRWAGSWEFAKWGNAGRNQGVQTLRWALTSDQLVVGSNTLTLRVSAAPNAGPNSLPDGVTPYFDNDYVALIQGVVNYTQPKRYVGSTEYWTNSALVARQKQEDLDRGGTHTGQTWINYLLNMNTLDSDIEMVEEAHWTASYPDLTWMDVEPARLVWDETLWSYYRYYYQTLRNAGVQRILVKIQYTPKWASTNPTSEDYDDYPPTCYCMWQEFIKETALRVGDIVDDYAIMNEVTMTGFWKGTFQEYVDMYLIAYDTLKLYDTIDADGDGVAAFVAPSASNEPGQTQFWIDSYNAMKPKIQAFHTHDYKWGLKPALDTIQAIDPSLQYLISETGPANWFIDEGAVPEYNPAEAASAIGYLLLDTTSTLDFLTQWEFKGDPDKDAPWPNTIEWSNSEPDPYAHNDGYFDNFNTGTINIEPPGPPYTNWTWTSSGAYWQHWNWVLDWPGKSIPVEMSTANCDCQYEVDAVQYPDRIEVILTNFQGGYILDPRTFTITLKTPWTNVKVGTYDPDDYTSSATMTGPTITLTASNLALDSTRWVLSNAALPYNDTPGVFIAAPSKSATVAVGSVTINADAFDDGTISSVSYRIDPINNGAFTNMTLVSGSRYTATASLTAGTHSIQVKVTDSTGKSSTVAHVVIVQ